MQLSFFCGTAHFWPDRWVGRWGRRILPGISRMPIPPGRVICAFGSAAPRPTVRRLRRPKGALPPVEKAGRTPAEPTPVPMQKGNTHGRALYACYAFLPLLKNAPMTSMTTKTIR